MADKSIKDMVNEMKKDSDSYFTLATIIWSRLSEEEQNQLVFVATQRNTWEGLVIKDPVRLSLIDYGLITAAESGGESNLLVLTYPGYAVYEKNKSKDPNVRLPGETKP